MGGGDGDDNQITPLLPRLQRRFGIPTECFASWVYSTPLVAEGYALSTHLLVTMHAHAYKTGGPEGETPPCASSRRSIRYVIFISRLIIFVIEFRVEGELNRFTCDFVILGFPEDWEKD